MPARSTPPEWRQAQILTIGPAEAPKASPQDDEDTEQMVSLSDPTVTIVDELPPVTVRIRRP